MDPNNLNNNQGNMPAGDALANNEPIAQGIPPVGQNAGMFGSETGDVDAGAPIRMMAPVTPNDIQASAQQQSVSVGSSAPISVGRGGSSKIKEILPLVLLSISTAAGVICAVVFFLQWQEAQSNIDLKIGAARAEASEEQKVADEKEFEKREKEPNKTFAGPDDYGGLTFSYPKTWSAFVSNDASGGGDFEAYLNPDIVNPISNNNSGSSNDLDDDPPIHALRVHIYDKSIDAVRKEFDEKAAEEHALTSTVYTRGEISGTLYEGTLEEGIEGRSLIFKKNDKTIELRTDSSVFYEDFDNILKTVRVNN